MKKILVLMATYNGGRYIDEQIQTILNQEGLIVHLLIADDNSSDDTEELVYKYIKDERVKFFRNNPSSGSAASNFLTLLMSVENSDDYDAFAFSDQDDIWLPEKLIKALNCLEINKASLYASNLIMWDERTNKRSLILKSYPQKKYDYLFEGGSAGCTYVFCRDFYQHLRVSLGTLDYKTWLNFSHDWYVYFFARLNQYNVYIDSNAYILYRIHDSNVHGHLNSSSLNSMRERIRLVRKGWYSGQIDGFKKLLDINSVEYKIYNLYTKNLFNRMYMLMIYNFKLMRSPVKFLMFALVSLFPIKRN